MKAHITGLLLILCSFPTIKVHAQPQNLYKRNYLYAYDATGNRTQRKYLLLICPSCRKMTTVAQKTIVADSLFKEALKNPIVLPPVSTEVVDNSQYVQLKNIYPNPTKGNILIQFTNPVQQSSLQVLDISGNKINEVFLNGSEWQLDLSLFPAGEYLFYIRMDDGRVIAKKIIKL